MQKLFNTLFTLSVDHNSGFRESLVAAILFKKRIVAFGFNQNKTHPFQAKYAKNEHAIFLHAETDAIQKALRRGIDLSKCSLYVVRSKENGKKHVTGNSKPCSGCTECIKDHNLRNVFFTEEGVDEFKRLILPSSYI